VSVARLVMPVGIVPELSEFTRHLWRFRDDGESVLSAPPGPIYSLALDDPDDVEIATDEARRLTEEFEFGDRVSVDLGKVWPAISFRDVETLHTFVRLIAMRGGRVDGYKARLFGAFVMETLGYEWT
jgi:hypothetical protein